MEMNDPVKVVIESLPSDDMSLYVSIASGVFVPILLLGITWLAERRAKAYAAALRLSDQRQLFSDNVHLAIDNLFKSVQTLRLINLKRKRHEEWSEQTSTNNNIIMSSTSEEAKLMQQDLLKWHLENNLDLESQHGTTLVEVVSAQVRVQHLLTEEHTVELDAILKQIRSASVEPGDFTEEMSGAFAKEINAIMAKVESNPEIWITP